MGDFLTGGRRTRFAPSVSIERETLRRGAEPIQRDPTVARGLAEGAAKLLADPAFGHVMDKLALDAHELFASSGGKPETREAAYMQLRALETIIQDLGTLQDDFRIYEAREAENPSLDI